MFIEISENSTDFTDDDIINEAITFMLAGQDSVGAGIAFTLFYLAKHVEIQMKVIQEIDSIYERNSNLSITELNDMIFLEQCLKESLRLAPSVPIISRVLTEDVVLGFKFAILEMKVIISTILRYYKISLAPPHENLTFSYKTTLKAKDGIWLCLKPRHKGMSI
ncbi:hypothetical protein NQ318_003109 [Aromia moschata]|uniref:Cytochrome P450 n=1 Tax=Aromia moschata TaxID=1265417 RepID=A0AAV8YT08_9CUCU|nr:hypothetical protein NQ318_003109 [Aromia moschata]